jgi:hypothetical protein
MNRRSLFRFPEKNRPLKAIIVALIFGFLASASSKSAAISDRPLARLEPASGTYFGVNLDWGADSPSSYDQRLGHEAAVFVQFVSFPLEKTDLDLLDATVQAVSDAGGMLMVTLEPSEGLDAITLDACQVLADKLAAYYAQGVPTFIRFAHEMNGSWYLWSQQPTAYIKAFRLIANTFHNLAPQTAMVWAPNYGGGYPFSGGQFEVRPDNPDFKLLDTNHDGKLNMNDDPYEPYYPGDDAVDWVGMSLYHWGNIYPWGENEIPENGKFMAQLTGTYKGLNGDDSAIPDFYATYYEQHGKPMAILETAAFYDPQGSGPEEIYIKELWWRQVFDPALLSSRPGIKMINWFEHAKTESEVGGKLVDWRALGTPTVADQFRADLPLDLLVFAK